jgi:hypothetical protein
MEKPDIRKKLLAIGNPVYDRINTPVLIREDRVLSGCSTNASQNGRFSRQNSNFIAECRTNGIMLHKW